MKPAEELAELWASEALDMKAIEAVAISSWKTYQLVYFLDTILRKSPLPPGNKEGIMSWAWRIKAPRVQRFISGPRGRETPKAYVMLAPRRLWL